MDSALLKNIREFATGPISAVCCYDRHFKPFWLGQINGKCVTMKDVPRTNQSKEAAMADSEVYKKHAQAALENYTKDPSGIYSIGNSYGR